MRYFFVLFFLLVIQFERPVFADEYNVDGNVGTIVEIPATKIQGKLLKCEAIFHGSPQNKTHEIYPGITDSDFRHTGYESCEFRINKLLANHFGKWSVKTIYNNLEGIEKTYTDTVFLYEIEVVNALPYTGSSTIYVEEGDYVTLHIKKQNNDMQSDGCYLSNKTETYNLKNLTTKDTGISLYGECGVRMLADYDRDGTWTIFTLSGYKKFAATFTIDVKTKSNKNSSKQFYEQWYQGETDKTITLTSELRNIYCEIQRPDGHIIPLKTSDCKYKVNKVSTSHTGIWIARYGLKHSMELVEEYYNIEVWDPQRVNVSVVKNANDDSIHILCEVPVNELEQCMFEKPDGTVKVLPAAVGNDNYEYFGSGYQELPTGQKAQCGLTIRKPISTDFGLWKCLMRYKTRETTSALINVDLSFKKIRESQLSTSQTHTYVKRGDNFLIKCSVDAQLDYCWMQSPNGTIYSVTKNKNSMNSLEYRGEGLTLGVCGAVVENADDTYSGDWNCQMGVHSGAEVKSIVPVTVTDSYLIPGDRKVDIGNGEKSTELLCRIFPNAEIEIDYCRWVRPDGRGIYQNGLTKYKVQQNKNSCSVQLKYWDIEDVGLWRCYARMMSDSDEEHHANIYFYPSIGSSYVQYRYFSLNFLLIGLFLSVSGTTAFLLFYRKKQPRILTPTLPLKLPPTYSISNEIYEEKKKIESS